MCFWLSVNPDLSEKRFVQAGDSLFLSKRFQTLSLSERFLYLCMAMESGGKRDFTFPRLAAKKYGIPPSTFYRIVNTLEMDGFIKVCHNKNTREANDYQFCEDWKYRPHSKG